MLSVTHKLAVMLLVIRVTTMVLLAQVQVLGAKLAWLVRVCAAMIGGHYALETQIKIEGSRVMPTVQMGTNMQEGDELVDAAGAVFRAGRGYRHAPLHSGGDCTVLAA